jgi:hypothetical protein
MDLGDLLWKGNPHMVFPSHKTLTKTILPFMTKHTLEEFVLLHVDVVVSIITKLNFWMSTCVFNTFTFVISSLTLGWESKHVTIGVFYLKGTWDIWCTKQLQFVFQEYGLTNKTICYVKDEGVQICLQWKMPLSLLWIVRILGFRIIWRCLFWLCLFQGLLICHSQWKGDFGLQLVNINVI